MWSDSSDNPAIIAPPPPNPGVTRHMTGYARVYASRNNVMGLTGQTSIHNLLLNHRRTRWGRGGGGGGHNFVGVPEVDVDVRLSF